MLEIVAEEGGGVKRESWDWVDEQFVIIFYLQFRDRKQFGNTWRVC